MIESQTINSSLKSNQNLEYGWAESKFFELSYSKNFVDQPDLYKNHFI